MNQNEINTAKLIFEKWDLSTDKDNLNAALPITTFSKIIDVDPIEITDKTIIKLLTTSITYLKKHFNNLMPKWSDVNRLIRGKENLPLSGGPDIARAIYTKRTSNGQLQATAGDCYILLINWDSNGKLFSESIHQYGSATNITDSRNYNNQSKLFAGIVMISLNIGSKYISISLSKSQEDFLRNAIGHQILVFAMSLLGTRDIIYATVLTAAFTILTQYLFNETSMFLVLCI